MYLNGKKVIRVTKKKNAGQIKVVDPKVEIQNIKVDPEYSYLSEVKLNAVTSKIDENIKPENIKEGISILGVEGISGGKWWAKMNEIISREVKEIIPEDLPNMTEIPNNLFRNCNNLINVTLPSSVNKINEYAFNGCDNLKFINLENISNLASYCFGPNGNYTSYRELNIQCTNNSYQPLTGYYPQLRKLILGNNVLTYTIRNLGSFGNNSKKLIEIYNLSSTTLTKGSSNYGGIAYNAWVIHTSMDEPSIITKDSNGFVFAYYDNKGYLIDYDGEETDITLPSSFVYNNQVINNYEIYTEAFIYHNKLKSIVIPESVTKINNRAFYSCENLQNIVIQNNNIELGNDCFELCPNLLPMYYSNNIYYIGNENNNYLIALKTLNKNMTSLKVNDGCKIIYQYAFENCDVLESLIIPNSVISIQKNILLNDAKVKSISIPFVGEKRYDGSENTQYSLNIWLYGDSYSSDPNHPNNLRDGSLQYMKYNGSVTTRACHINDWLQSITITDSNYIPPGSFSFLYNVNEVNLIQDINTILPYTFYYMTNLENIEISKSITSIQNSAFLNCNNLTKIYYDSTDINDWAKINISGAPIFNEYNINYFYLKDINGEIEYKNKNYSLLEKIKITDETITSISNYAFYGFNNITELDIPSTVNSSSSYSFSACKFEKIKIPMVILTNIPKTYLKDVEIINGTSLTSSVFSNITSLESVILPDTLTSIGSSAFYNCINLKYINLGSSITSIASSAFYGCYSLSSIILPTTLSTISTLAFNECYNLFEIYNLSNLSLTPGSTANGYVSYYATVIHSTILEESSIVTDENGFVFSYHPTYGSYLVRYDGESTTTLNLPESYIYNNEIIDNYKIHLYFAQSCQSIGTNLSLVNNILMSNSITTVESYAFSRLNSIKEIKFSKNLTSIGAYSFNYLSLTKLDISDTHITSIGSYAFENCGEMLQSFLPATLNSIADYAFRGCFKLYEVYNLSNLNIYTGSTYNGYAGYYALRIHKSSSEASIYVLTDEYLFAYGSSNNSVLVSYSGNDSQLILPDNFISPQGTTVTSYNLGVSCFENNKSITSVICSSAVRVIKSKAFNGCSNLTYLDIGINTEAIASYDCYSNCNSLQYFIIHNSLTSFPKDYSLARLNNLHYNTYNGCNYLGDENNPYIALITSDKESTTCEISGSCKFYQYYVFNESLVENLTIPVEWINKELSYLIGLPPKLKTLNLPIITARIGDLFERWDDDIPSDFYKARQYTDGVYDYNDYAIPKTLETISINSNELFDLPKGCFCNISTLKNILNLDFEKLTSIPDYSLANCGLTQFNISNNVTYLGSYAFWNNDKLTNVTIGNSITEIPNFCFNGCSSLVEINIPSNITYLGTSCFRGCSSLTGITIPDTVTYIGQYALGGCTSLQSITLPFIGQTSPSASSGIGYPIGFIFENTSGGGYYVQQYYQSSSSGGTSRYSAYIPSSLKEINVTNSPYIQYGAFYGCYWFTKINILDTTTQINKMAFYNCSGLQELYLSKNITSLDEGILNGCGSLQKLNIPFVGARSYNQSTVYPMYPLGYIFGTTSYSGASAVESRYYSTSSSYTTYTTYWPNSLVDITINNSKYINKYAFYNSVNLTKVTFSDVTLQIQENVFSSTSGYSKYNLYCYATTPPSLLTYGLGNAIAIYVPSGSVNTYKSASRWSSYSSKIFSI